MIGFLAAMMFGSGIPAAPQPPVTNNGSILAASNTPTLTGPFTNYDYLYSSVSGSGGQQLFRGFVPGSLGGVIWSNFLRYYTNYSSWIWSQYALPAAFPTSFIPGSNLPPAAATMPVLSWYPGCFLTNYPGFTAISQCNTMQGSKGQCPVTLLTPRHGYTRGHGTGFTSCGAVDTNNASIGHRVYFCTASNTVVEADVMAVVNTSAACPGSRGDYTIFFFSNDVPSSITPMMVGKLSDIWPNKYFCQAGGAGGVISPGGIIISYYEPVFICCTEQSGHAAVNLTPLASWSPYTNFCFNALKGGDSGAPNMLLMPDHLVFLNGTTTTLPPQSALDALTIAEGLSTNNYQMKFYDFSAYPSFPRP
jgi:hypothetical protein